MHFANCKREVSVDSALEMLNERRDPNQVARDSDIRSPYEIDRARIIHSAGFRRLQAKTQVLGIGEGDFRRTRLTHSLEVSQIGYGIVKYIRKTVEDATIREFLPTRDCIEAICLAHDLGHPPFGHAGEVALNKCMSDYGGFEGNGQTLRLISKLEARKGEYGLDLTRRVMLGVLKYPSDYESCNDSNFVKKCEKSLQPSKLWKPPKCYLSSETDVVRWILSSFVEEDIRKFCEVNDPDRGSPASGPKHFKPLHRSFDASIMEAADDLAYAVHDLEDAIALRLIGKDDIEALHVDMQAVRSHPGALSTEDWSDLFSSDSGVRKEKIGKLVNFFVHTVHVLEKKEFSNKILDLNVAYPGDVRKLLDKLVKLNYEKVISSQIVQILESRGQMMVESIFNAISSDPERFLKAGQKYWLEKSKSKRDSMRVVCDYISGMSDEYASRVYERFFIPRVGSAFERL